VTRMLQTTLAASIAAAVGAPNASGAWPVEGADSGRRNADPTFTVQPPYGLVWTRSGFGGGADRGFASDGFIEHGSTVGDGRLYVQVINGTVTAVNATTGSVIWRRFLGTKASGAPAYSARRSIVVVHNNRPGRLYVLRAGTGATRWRRNTGGGETSPLLLAGGIFVANSRGVVMKFSYGGRRVWRRSLGWKITGSLASSRYLIASDYGGYITALQHTNGRVVWRRRTASWSSHYAAPVVHRGRIYQTSRQGEIYALSVSTGRIAWSRTLGWGTRARAAPTVVGNRVFAASFNGLVYCLRWDGRMCWRRRFPGSVKGALASTGANLIWVCHRTSRQRRTELGRLRAIRPRTARVVWSWAHCSHAPISTGTDLLYINDFSRIWAMQAAEP
jgi:outer membrane protein assembly factor BamB